MGILTDPSLSRRNQFGRILIKHKRKICICLYLSSLIWFCFLGHEDYNHSTYLSENALSPGLVYSEIRYTSAKFATTLLEELELQRQSHPDEIPYAWIQAKMKQIGLEVFTHNFTLHYPFGGGKKFQGKNVYGILQAPRISSTEGIVFSTPYRPKNSVQHGTTASLAVLLAFADFASRKSYWAKDLIFLVTDQEQLGMNAWLKAYHYDTHGDNTILDAGHLKGRSGSLQAALNLEIESFDANDMDVKIEGLNGQLPNLDLFNLVQRLGIRENLFTSIKYLNKKRRKGGDFKENLKNMMAMILTQANGVPTGNHGLFHPYRIEALSITGRKRENSNSDKKYVNAQTILKTVEGISRSLNNLLERFHQSFFFYILVTDDRFVSIGDYMPCLGLMVGAILIKGFLLWLSINDWTSESQSDKKSDQDQVEEKPKIIENVDLNFEEVGYIFGMAQMIGLAAYYLPQNKTLNEIIFKNNISTEMGIFIILAAIGVVAFLTPTFKQLKKYQDIELLHIVALLHLASILIIVGLLNFSLGFLLALISTPFAIFFDVNHGKIFKSLRILYIFLLNPLVIVYGLVSVLTFHTFPELLFSEVLVKSAKATVDSIMFSIVDLIVYGNWLFRVATITFLTSWTLFWYLSWAPKTKSCEQKIKSE